MGYESVRAQLDKLLGADRNGPSSHGAASPSHYADASVCKHYLLGFCPHELSIKHRSEPGSCALSHPPAARDAFTAARAAGDPDAQDRAARWTRHLLSECTAIRDDEERRIRAHARRLQESYDAKGPLAGLMIRDFDTLKKLGMVSQDAKVQVLSEMDGLDGIEETHEERSAADEEAVEKEKDHAPAEDEVPVQKPAAVVEEPRSSSENDDGAEEDAGDAEGDGDDDDDDDFGVISVIPASATKEDQDDPKPPVECAEDAAAKVTGEKPSHNAADVQPAPTDAPVQDTGNGPVPLAKDIDQPEETKRDQDDVAPREASAEVQTEPTAPDASKPVVLSHEPEDKMEEFYKSGVGPDGLVMLTRKQSLRVCACCGGFISLVDAESRLLSHYGGKSHHSLVLLRDKVAELENTVTQERAHGRRHRSPRDYRRGRRDERETNWSRGDDRRPRHWDTRDHDRGRRERFSEHDRHGTVDWQHRSYRRHSDRGGDRGHRSRYEDRYEDDQRSKRYGYGRKRYRSRSPTRDNRRQRSRY